MFNRIKLPFELNALEPYMSKEQIYYHYNKHHLAYEISINDILKNVILPDKIKNLEDLMIYYTCLPKNLHFSIRNMGGGLINHNLFFSILGKNKILKNTIFIDDINYTFGSFENLKNQLITEGKKIFGSGWTWLVINKNNNLSIINTYNQDNPWFLGVKPILGIDIWEHAYYIDYRNDRQKYLENIFYILNWDKITELYIQNKK